jgi:hypothetical protein
MAPATARLTGFRASSCRSSLPPGFQRIRHFGFLANCHRRRRLPVIRRLLSSPVTELLPEPRRCRPDTPTTAAALSDTHLSPLRHGNSAPDSDSARVPLACGTPAGFLITTDNANPWFHIRCCRHTAGVCLHTLFGLFSNPIRLQRRKPSATSAIFRSIPYAGDHPPACFASAVPHTPCIHSP